MKQQVAEPQVQYNEPVQQKASEKTESAEACIARLTDEIRQLESVILQKLERGETDINGICQLITRKEEKRREYQSKITGETDSNAADKPKRKAMVLIGNGIIDIRTKVTAPARVDRSAKKEDVHAKSLLNQ
jgi:hypothetical protein